MRTRLLELMIAFGILLSIGACVASPKLVTWQEEVKLLDGRTIVVEQMKTCEGAYTGGNYADCIARESWVTINLPELSAKPIVWHEHLFAIIVNIYNGKLFVVGSAPTQREYKFYGDDKPLYISFIWENDHWKRIPFNEIPTAIYDTNMLLEAIPLGMKYLTRAKKESSEMNGDPRTAKQFRRLDPDFMK